MVLLDISPATARVMRATRYLADRDDRWVLGYHPVARMNPFQALLYKHAIDAGFVPVGLTDWSEVESLRVARQVGSRAALHLHWTSRVLAPAENEADAERRADAFIANLKSLSGAGVRIVWTVHNVLPHQCVYPSVEARMRSALIDVADVVHVMAEETASATANHYTIPPAKTIHVPHPSYVGAYPSHLDRDILRFEMGYDRNDLVLGMVGSIQLYKGIPELIDVTKRLVSSDPDLRVIVAGIVGRDPGSADLVAQLEREVHIEVLPRRLSDIEMASIVTAADAIVLPYRSSLNSGAALLGLSFGTPIVAPRTGSFTSIIEAGMGVGYDLDDVHGLERALSSVRSLTVGFDRQAALEAMSEISGDVVSRMFFESLSGRLGV